ncbi:hypothetical protein L593_09725 [Salinarchaeum sp. Harcht-Bsk1]|uniref:ferritin-like domain-containing protein n=1 Tax=Salinarchaeum sp. Harcht-Bsk1 TaxID=1333523 RepID=UPI0003423053|nr:ferritin-like domain-containing protein [Salinarchaeum sp. Harcht-Bsk1]AGN01890.1 hypothetical protein L593_09725 [Salinarchaeum sp. Harcht-Bsk1]
MTDPDTTHDRAECIATSVRDQFDDEGTSRRSFVTRSALAGGTLLALGGAAGMGLAQDDGDGETSGNETEDEVPAFENLDGTDLEVLNYALTLEQLERGFYERGLEQFTEEDFVNAESLQAQPEAVRQAVYAYVQRLGEQERIHANLLTEAVDLLGGTPAEPAAYDFGFETVDEMLVVGQTLENAGVAAYAGVAPLVESPDLLSAALAIHSVEARHAAIFNYLLGDSPFPDPFDPALSPDEVLEAVSGFYETVPAEVPGDVEGNLTDGMDGNVTGGNATGGTNGDGTNGNATDETGGNATTGNDTADSDTAGG